MASTDELLLALVVLYLAECLFIVRRSGYILWTWPWGPARITSARHLPGAIDWGVFLAVPVPPFGKCYQCEFWPVALSPAGVTTQTTQCLAAVASSEPIRCIAFAALRDVATIGATVYINGAHFVHCAAEATAHALANLLHTLRDEPESERGALLERAIAQRLDEAAAARIIRNLSQVAPLMLLSSHALFALLFIATPYVVYRIGLERAWMPLLCSLAILWAYAAIVFWWAHRRMFAGQVSDRRRRVLMVSLTPMAALRSHDALTRHALAPFHPLAAAHALCDADRYRDFAQDVYRDLVYPRHSEVPTVPPQAAPITAWHRAALRAACEALLRRTNCEPAELLATPLAGDEQSKSYCPRCRTQFVHVSGTCDQCGVALAPLNSAS